MSSEKDQAMAIAENFVKIRLTSHNLATLDCGLAARHYAGLPVLANISVKNWRILLQQSFTANGNQFMWRRC